MASYGGETPVNVVSEIVIPSTFSYTVPAGKYLKALYYKNNVSSSTSNILYNSAVTVIITTLQNGQTVEIFASSGTVITVSAGTNTGIQQGLLTGLLYNNPS